MPREVQTRGERGLLISEGLLWPEEAPEMKTPSEVPKREGLCPEVWPSTLALTWLTCGEDSGLLQT